MRTKKTNLVNETFAVSNRYSELMDSCARLASDKNKSWCREDKNLETLRQIAIVAMESYMEAVGERAYKMEEELYKKAGY